MVDRIDRNMGAEAMRAATGRSHVEWRDLLQAAGALEWSHRQIADWLVAEKQNHEQELVAGIKMLKAFYACVLCVCVCGASLSHVGCSCCCWASSGVWSSWLCAGVVAMACLGAPNAARFRLCGTLHQQ